MGDNKYDFKHLLRHNKEHQRKILLSSFHLNGHTLGYISGQCLIFTLYKNTLQKIKYFAIMFIS